MPAKFDYMAAYVTVNVLLVSAAYVNTSVLWY